MKDVLYFEPIQGADHLELQDCVLQFLETQNSHLFRVILYKLKPTFLFFVYKKSNYSDKATLLALCEDTLMKSIESYNVNSGAQFSTFFRKCLVNAFINFHKLRKDKNISSLDETFELKTNCNDSSSIEKFSEIVSVPFEDGIKDFEKNILLESLEKILTPNEYRVCKIIADENVILTYREIAEEVGLTFAAIPGILKKLRHRFNSEVYPKNLFKSL